MKKWREENQGSRSLQCPHCGKMVLLKIRTDIWESLKHPFFKDKILANTHLMEMYRIGKISKHDVAKVLGTSVDYVAWLVKKIYQKEFNKEERKRWEVEQETVTAEKETITQEESSKAVDEVVNELPTVNSDASQ
jgi:DNA-directed RNA polymerase subunit RPC12/RpoP